MEQPSYPEEPHFPDLSFAVSLLNGMGEAIAVLNEQGTILYTNECWRGSEADSAKLPPLQTGREGQNYVERLPLHQNLPATLLESLRAGIEAVLAGSLAFHAMDYSLSEDEPDRRRHLKVSPLLWRDPATEQERRFVLLRHADVTSLVQTLRIRWEAERVTQLREEQIEEILAYEKIGLAELSNATARLYGKMSLRESQPEVFESLLQRFSVELQELLHSQSLFLPESEFPERIRALGDQLGFLRVGVRDVIALYSLALKKSIADANPERSAQIMQAGRLMLLELLGHLVTHYRKYSWAMFRPEEAPLSEM